MHFMTYAVTINPTFSFIKEQYANTTMNKSLNLSTLIVTLTSPRQTLLFAYCPKGMLSFQHESKSDTLLSEPIRLENVLYAYIVDGEQQ